MSFGAEINRPDLAEIVEHLYDSALQESSKKTYGTGQRAYFRFVQELNKEEAYVPFHPKNLSRTELYLAFYIAYLVLKPTVNKATTILAYEGHVKYFFREQGCLPDEYKTPFLGQIRKGVQSAYPQQADKREAFFLPLYFRAQAYREPESKTDHLARISTVLGFFGMLRPHTFSQLGPRSFVFVHKNGSLMRLGSNHDVFQQGVEALPQNENTSGFYLTFKSKTMEHARAYFPNLSALSSAYKPLCPLRLLKDIVKRGWVEPGFLDKVGRGAALKKYLQRLIGSKGPVSPYALRIGGRTWNITHGMDRQFVDYLGTWKSPEASARYYRERPGAVLKKVARFYINLGDPSTL